MRRFAFALVAVTCAVPGCHVHDDDGFFFGTVWPGDFNHDGFADVTVGAPLDDDGIPASDRGRVYFYRGSSSPGNVADLFISGTEIGGQFGASVAAIGDFNGDGRADLAVGAPLEDGSAVDSGRVHVYFGGAGFPVAGPVLDGTEAGGQFGACVARAGDVNRDGFDDLLVGAPMEDGGAVDSGRAHLFLGGSSPAASPFLTFNGAEVNGRFGRSASTAGDADGDSYFDVVIGAPLEDAGGADRGRAYFYRGGPATDNVADQTFTGTEDLALFGWSVSGIFDLNTDGYHDIAIGAPDDDGDGVVPANSGTDLGRAYVFFGGATVDATPDRTYTGFEPDSRFGELVARIGDLNAGGAVDFVVGAPLDDGDGNTGTDSGDDRGRAFVYFGGNLTDTIADVTYVGADLDSDFGIAADSPGDVNGDGIRDLVIGAPTDDAGGLDRGQAFLYRGASSPPTSPFQTYSGIEDDATFGQSVALRAPVGVRGASNRLEEARHEVLACAALSRRMACAGAGRAIENRLAL